MTGRHMDLTYDEICICRVQGDVFRYVALIGTDMEWFTKAYLESDFCRRAMDTVYSRFQSTDELEHLDFLLPETGPLVPCQDGQCFDADVAYWIGFMYRQYHGLHTVDEEMTSDIICGNLGLSKAWRE